MAVFFYIWVYQIPKLWPKSPRPNSLQMKFTYDHIVNATTTKELLLTAAENNIPVSKTIEKLQYEAELRELQSELVNLQQWIAKKQIRVAVFLRAETPKERGVVSSALKNT